MTVPQNARKPKEVDPRLLARAVSDALAHQTSLGDPIGSKFDFEIDLGGKSYLITARPRPASWGVACLSPREREIVRLVARGLPNKAIAQVLDISLWTVATHIRRVFAKLGVASRAEMVANMLLSESVDVTSRDELATKTPRLTG